ncbi:MAG: hypothetical protein ACRDM7_05840 [Thermoleophilaceae bacterium]
MAVLALLVLLLGSFAGLLIGRWHAVLPVAAAIPAGALLSGPEAGALGVLGVAGFAAGLQLHRVVAEQYVPR